MDDNPSLTFALALEIVYTDDGPQFRFQQINDGIPLPFCTAMIDAWLDYNQKQFRNDFKARYL